MRKFDKLCARILNTLNWNTLTRQRFLGQAGGCITSTTMRLKRRGRYVEGAEFGKDLIYNMHKILASCVQPMTWYGKIKPYDATKAQPVCGRYETGKVC